MKNFPVSTLFLGVFIFSLLVISQATFAEAIDDTTSDKTWSVTSAHGLIVGKGNVSYNGVHVQDSASLKLNQNLSDGILSETGSASANTSLNSKTLQNGVGDFSMRYKFSGISVGADLGFNYATVVYNKLSRRENQNSGAHLNASYGFSISKNTILNSDSTLEWNLDGSFDAIQNQFKTWSGSTDLQKTWGDFSLDVSLSTFNQTQYENLTSCTPTSGKGGGPNTCSSVSPTTNLNGYDLSSSLDWTGDYNALSFSTAMDWQLTASVQRTVSGGVTYTLTPWKWLNLNLMASRETNLDATKNAKLWLLGTSVEISF